MTVASNSLRLVMWVLLLGACSSRVQKTTIGTAPAAIGASSSAEILVQPGMHEVELQLELPRAMRVRAELSCAGNETHTWLGETWQVYRKRRLAQLEQDRRRNARLLGRAVGAITGNATVKGNTRGGVRVEASVDTGEAAEGVAEAVLPRAQLPAWDVGARRVQHTFRMVVKQPGACRMVLVPGTQHPDLRGTFVVRQVIDLAERRAKRRRIAVGNAERVRHRITRNLVDHGADPDLRERVRLAATRKRQQQIHRNANLAYRVRAKQRRRLHRQLQTTVSQHRQQETTAHTTRRQLIGQLQAHEAHVTTDDNRAAKNVPGTINDRDRHDPQRARQLAHTTRHQVIATLLACGADPQYQQNRAEAEMAAFEARKATRLRNQKRIAREMNAALGVRVQVGAHLERLGATPRPPVPPAPATSKPERPTLTAIWIEGRYQWLGGSWIWHPGAWVEPPHAKATWLPSKRILLGGSVVVRPGIWIHGNRGRRIRANDRKPQRKRRRRHR